MSWSAHVLTIFPELFPGVLGHSITGRALTQELWTLVTHNLRDHTTDRHQSVDDTPFGGGAGMVMRPDVIGRCIESLDPDAQTLSRLYLSPRGKPLDQSRVQALSAGPGITILCGRYEGIDQRAIDRCGFEEISIGDYVVSGGELAAFVLLDACVRLLPGVLGTRESLFEESFSGDLLEYPQYTRPQVWEGYPVPDTLLSGHHEKIRAWRLAKAEEITRERRPDLWKKYLSGITDAGSKRT